MCRKHSLAIYSCSAVLCAVNSSCFAVAYAVCMYTVNTLLKYIGLVLAFLCSEFFWCEQLLFCDVSQSVCEQLVIL